MPEVGASEEHAGIHSDIMDCVETPTACSKSFAEHLSFLSSFAPGLTQDLAGRLLTLLTIIPLATWLIVRGPKILFREQAFYKIKLKQYQFASLQWFVLPQLTLAFSRGIINTKRFSA